MQDVFWRQERGLSTRLKLTFEPSRNNLVLSDKRAADTKEEDCEEVRVCKFILLEVSLISIIAKESKIIVCRAQVDGLSGMAIYLAQKEP